MSDMDSEDMQKMRKQLEQQIEEMKHKMDHRNMGN